MDLENMPNELDIAKAMVALPFFILIASTLYLGLDVLPWLLGIMAVVSAGVWFGSRNLEELVK